MPPGVFLGARVRQEVPWAEGMVGADGTCALDGGCLLGVQVSELETGV